VLIALTFDYINGFHDAANSIATVVSTRVLTPGQAVVWAAFFNFAAAFVVGTAVAKTVGAGMVDLSVVTFSVIHAGLLGAIGWDLITWFYGLPTSSSRALFGGYAGAAIVKAGFGALIPSGWTKTSSSSSSHLLGTLTGGWRIIHTMGSKITKLQPVGGFAAETGAAVAIFIATHFGVGVSTTHTITGAIIGVGATRRLSAVRWGVARRILWAWVLTIPAAAFFGGAIYFVIALVGGR
jgi:phosphate/sulfate permease